jgi:LAO/AO transport system kinase
LTLAERVMAGEVRALARACTLVESRAAEGQELLRAVWPAAGRALVVGITGAPGVGKSTLASALVAVWRGAGKRVAVLAVDPTSPFTGGAVLGDRVRMMVHAGDEGVFVRSMASRGKLGGRAAATSDMTLLCEAAGFDVVMVETVGVGQGEVDVARLAGVTVVVLAPGMGDEVQAIKAGVMEIADVFCVNKSDRAGAEELAREVHAAAPEVPLVKTIAAEGVGVAELAAAVEACGAREGRAAARWAGRLREMVVERLMESVGGAEFEAAGGRVARRETDPYSAADGIVRRLLGRG